jgi:hypothetical protein
LRVTVARHCGDRLLDFSCIDAARRPAASRGNGTFDLAHGLLRNVCDISAPARQAVSMKSLRENEFPVPSEKFPVPAKKFPVLSCSGNWPATH